MLQVRKSCFCGISAIFLKCCFTSETSINDSFRFLGFFSRNHFLDGGFTFQWWVGASFLSGGGASVLMGVGLNKSWDGREWLPMHPQPHPPPPSTSPATPLWETLVVSFEIVLSNKDESHIGQLLIYEKFEQHHLKK